MTRQPAAHVHKTTSARPATARSKAVTRQPAAHARKTSVLDVTAGWMTAIPPLALKVVAGPVAAAAPSLHQVSAVDAPKIQTAWSTAVTRAIK